MTRTNDIEPQRTNGAVFAIPRSSREWVNSGGVWIAIAGWAGAAERKFGTAWIAMPDMTATAEEVAGFGTTQFGNAQGAKRRRATHFLPQELRTGVKDLLRARAATRFGDVGERDAWKDCDVEFVWQYHDLFNSAGRPLATRRSCPLVAFVDGLVVWQARKWHVRRPGWATLLERLGERPQLLQSDVVACVSAEMVPEVIRLGVDEARVAVTPNGVDADRFNPAVSGDAVRARFGLADRFVVGWAGSFRRFHGLEIGMQAFARARRRDPEIRFLLVGDGPDREALVNLAASLHVLDAVVLTGAVDHARVPEYLAAMDIALVTARDDGGFHYSPLKLREYLASGCAVVAPSVGDVGRTLTDGRDALVYKPGDVDALATAIGTLLHDEALRASIAEAGRKLILDTATWDAQLQGLLLSAAYQRAKERLCMPRAESAGES